MLHTIYFDKRHGWNKKTSHNFLKYLTKEKPIKKAHETETQIRYRFRDPKMFSRFITKKLGFGIYFVIGIL